MLFTAPERHELDMVFQFQHVQLDIGTNKYDLLRCGCRPESLDGGLADRFGRTRLELTVGNHDQPRSLSRFGDDSAAHRVASAKTLATVLHLHRGTPYVYQGDELGMANAPFAAITDFRDIQALRFDAEAAERGQVDLPALLLAMAKRSRDQGRTPVQWDASPGAGFTTGTPWLAINPTTPRSTRPLRPGRPGLGVRPLPRLIALRHEDPVVTTATSSSAWRTTRRSGLRRRTADTELLVAANFSAEVCGARLPLDTTGKPPPSS